MAIRIQIKRSNQGSTPALDRYEILHNIRQARNPRDKALIATLYLTACRIEELLKYKHYRLDITGQPVKKEQIEIRGDEIIFRNIRCLKLTRTRNGVKEQRAQVRNIPIIINALEQPLINYLTDYIKTLALEDPLFNITRWRAYQILSQIGIYPHLLRHARLTHLAVDYDFGEAQLRHFTGWSTSNTAKHYTHLNIGDLLSKMRRAQV